MDDGSYGRGFSDLSATQTWRVMVGVSASRTEGVEICFVFTVMTDISWMVKNPVGYSTLLLDQHLYKELTHLDGRPGLRITNMPIQVIIVNDRSFPNGIFVNFRALRFDSPPWILYMLIMNVCRLFLFMNNP